MDNGERIGKKTEQILRIYNSWRIVICAPEAGKKRIGCPGGHHRTLLYKKRDLRSIQSMMNQLISRAWDD